MATYDENGDQTDDGEEQGPLSFASEGGDLGYVPPATFAAAQADLVRQRADYSKGLAATINPMLQHWDDMARQIKAQRLAPTRAENLFQLSAAMAAPTRYKGFGASFGNVMPVLAEQQKNAREAEMQKMMLLDKYQTAGLQAQAEQGKTLLGAPPPNPAEMQSKYFLAQAAQQARQKQVDAQNAMRVKIAQIRASQAQRPPANPVVDAASALYPDRAVNPAHQALWEKYIMSNSPAALAQSRKPATKQGPLLDDVNPWDVH